MADAGLDVDLLERRALRTDALGLEQFRNALVGQWPAIRTALGRLPELEGAVDELINMRDWAKEYGDRMRRRATRWEALLDGGPEKLEAAAKWLDLLDLALETLALVGSDPEVRASWAANGYGCGEPHDQIQRDLRTLAVGVRQALDSAEEDVSDELARTFAALKAALGDGKVTAIVDRLGAVAKESPWPWSQRVRPPDEGPGSAGYEVVDAAGNAVLGGMGTQAGVALGVHAPADLAYLLSLLEEVEALPLIASHRESVIDKGATTAFLVRSALNGYEQAIDEINGSHQAERAVADQMLRDAGVEMDRLRGLLADVATYVPEAAFEGYESLRAEVTAAAAGGNGE